MRLTETKLEITILKEDYRNCGKYIDPKNCLLATALKRCLPEQDILVSPHGFSIGFVAYRLVGNDDNRVQRASNWKWLWHREFKVTAIKQ